MSEAIRFPLGELVSTPGALEALIRADVSPLALFQRHQRGDWGEVCDDDKALNDQAVYYGERLLSSYRLPDGVSVWVITEWDRSVTTILLPSEY